MSAVLLESTSPIYDHGLLVGLGDDDHSQYALLAGRAGGQTLDGGTASTDVLNLRGSAHADLGFIHIASPIIFDDVSAGPGDSASWMTWSPTFAIPGAGLTQTRLIEANPTVTISAAASIFAFIDGTGTYTQNVVPNATFGSWILFNGAPVLRTTSTSFPPPSGRIFNAAPNIKVDGAGGAVPSTAEYFGLYAQPTLAATTSGDSLTMASMTAVCCAPQWNVPAGTTVNFGPVKGLWCRDIGQQLFGSSAGSKTVASYRAVSMDNITATVSGFSICVYSDLTAASNKLFLYNNGGAASIDKGIYRWTSGGYPRIAQESVGMRMGATDGTDGEVRWNTSIEAFEFITRANSNVGINLGWNRSLNFAGWNAAATAGDYGFRMMWRRFSFGANAPVPNPASGGSAIFFNISSDGKTPPAAGPWAEFAVDADRANLSVGAFAMTQVDSGLFDPVAVSISTGSVADLTTVRINGMGTVGATNQGLWVSSARARIDGFLNMAAITPAQLTANVDDWTGPGAGSTGRAIVRASSDASHNVNGIAVSQARDGFWLVNIGTNNIVLVHEAGTSTATNRFKLPGAANYTLAPDESVFVWHDDDLASPRWRILDK